MFTGKFQKTTLVGSIISAILASVCCIGPIAFALLGIGGAGFLLKFEAFRPVFIILTIGLLGSAFYLTFRKKPSNPCADGTYCAQPKTERLNKIVLLIATTLVLFTLFFPNIISIFT